MSRLLPALLPLLVAAPALAAVDDDFNDNATGPQWSLIVDNPAALNIAEQNGRLEAISNGTSSGSDDAIYLSNGTAGFRLATGPTDDFTISIDYSFTGFGSGSSFSLTPTTLVFGIGRDLDGTDSAAIGYAYATPTGPGFLAGAQRTNDAQSISLLGAAPANGTLTITYDAAGDDLTFTDGTLEYLLEDTVRTVWGADGLFVSFGVRGSGYVLASGDAYFDNFQIIEGNLLPVPEPATLGVLALLGVAALRRR